LQEGIAYLRGILGTSVTEQNDLARKYFLSRMTNRLPDVMKAFFFVRMFIAKSDNAGKTVAQVCLCFHFHKPHRIAFNPTCDRACFVTVHVCASDNPARFQDVRWRLERVYQGM